MDEDYLNLLKQKQELKTVDSEENREKYIILLRYEIRILDHFKWKQRHQYFVLMNNFLANKINTDQYLDELFELEHKVTKLIDELKLDFKKLKEFEPDPISEGFCYLIEDLLIDYRDFEPDPDLRDDYEISEEGIINGVRVVLLKIQKYL